MSDKKTSKKEAKSEATTENKVETAVENSAAAAGEAAEQKFILQRVYLKDISLEMPNAPMIFLEQEVPGVEISLSVGGQRLADTVFESTVRATVTTKIEDKTVYLVEATQAGIFEIENFEDAQVDSLLGIVCPSMLFPYLRANVADLINRTSLPPLHLAEVNFQALYEQNAQQAAEATKQ